MPLGMRVRSIHCRPQMLREALRVALLAGLLAGANGCAGWAVRGPGAADSCSADGGYCLRHLLVDKYHQLFASSAPAEPPLSKFHPVPAKPVFEPAGWYAPELLPVPQRATPLVPVEP